MVKNQTEQDIVIELKIDEAEIYDSDAIINETSSDFKYLKEMLEDQDQKIEKAKPDQAEVLAYEKYLK